MKSKIKILYVFGILTIILVLVAIFNKNYIQASILLIVYGVYGGYELYKDNLENTRWVNFNKLVAEKIQDKTNSIITTIPFPVIIITENGNIIWYNDKILNIVENENLLGKKITEELKGVNLEDIVKNKKNKLKDIKFKEKYFDVYVDKNIEENEMVIFLYLNDITNFKVQEESKECIMVIEVDNQDEIMKTIDDASRPFIAGRIEREIYNYGKKLNGMIRKYSTRRYILSIQEKYVDQEISKKFDILEKIEDVTKALDKGNNRQKLTISIGIGRGGKTPLENSDYAVIARDLALSRGGNQVVIKNGEKLTFFGGKTKDFEKLTKVRARIVAETLRELIKESSKVFIMGHKNPDIDCLGAAIGVNSLCRQLQKECNIVIDNYNPLIDDMLKKLREDREYDKIFINVDQCKNKFDDKSILIIVDVHNRGYVMDAELVDKFNNVVIIDHHRRASDYFEKNVLSYIETYASSTSELITEIIQYAIDSPKLKYIEAQCLLAGICLDTKFFYYKTGVRTFEAASFLRRMGADTIDIKKLFSDDFDTYVTKANIIKSAKINNGIAIAKHVQDSTDTIISAKVSDDLLSISNIRAAFVLTQIGNDVSINARSSNNVNVQIIMEKFGGGGHVSMAGAKVNNANIDDVEKQLEYEISENIKDGD